jgi:hypothetical protein
MAFNIRTSRTVSADVDIFKFPTNDQGFASIVLDAATVTADPSDGALRLRAGTPLFKNTSGQYSKFDAAANTAGKVCKGILPRTIEFADNTSKSDAPAELAFHGEVFRADRIIGFGTLGTQIRAALPTCRFD